MQRWSAFIKKMFEFNVDWENELIKSGFFQSRIDEKVPILDSDVLLDAYWDQRPIRNELPGRHFFRILRNVERKCGTKNAVMSIMDFIRARVSSRPVDNTASFGLPGDRSGAGGKS